MFDICIIGGGAAGMTAAISAAEENRNLSILVLEKMDKTGRKILASGNGKCNLSNLSCEKYRETESFFNHLGLVTRSDSEGRVYPYTEEAGAVVEALRDRMECCGVVCKTCSEVKSVEKEKDFRIVTEESSYMSRKVLIATGGKSGPQFGSTGDGYRLAKKLGHSVTKLVPVLTAVETEEDLSSLKGIRAKGEVSLEYKGECIFREKGEIQFTEKGISGICVFNLSRYLLIPEGCSFKDGFKDYTIKIDFIPEETDSIAFLENRLQTGNVSKENLLKYIVRQPVARLIQRKAGNSISEQGRLLKAYPLKPVNVRGWNFAQVTKGGVKLDEINMDTMESLICRNLYFAGEVIDSDGPCGGFNLQNAWETGIRAGKGMANG